MKYAILMKWAVSAIAKQKETGFVHNISPSISPLVSRDNQCTYHIAPLSGHFTSYIYHISAFYKKAITVRSPSAAAQFSVVFIHPQFLSQLG